MAFCDLSHTIHKQVTNVSQHVFVIIPWGILTCPLISPYLISGGRYTHCYVRLAPGSTAAHKTPTREGYGKKDQFFTTTHDYDAPQKAPVWTDKPTVSTGIGLDKSIIEVHVRLSIKIIMFPVKRPGDLKKVRLEIFFFIFCTMFFFFSFF